VIRRAAARVAANCAAAGAALVACSLMATPALVTAPADGSDPTAATDTRAAPEAARVSGLLERHGCWSDAAPAGAPEPGHAVVTLPGGAPRVVPADVGFAIWLEGKRGTLHGFCP